MVASCYTVQVLLIEWSLYEGQRTEWLMFSTTHQTVKRLTHYVIWTCRRGRGCKKLPIFANILYGWPLMLCVSDSPCYYAASQYYMAAACCYRQSSVVCRSVRIMTPAKMAELIEMPSGMWAQGTMYFMVCLLAPSDEYAWTVLCGTGSDAKLLITLSTC